MGIMYRLDDDCYVPIILCDVCGDEICGHGNVLFKTGAEGEPYPVGAYVTPVFVHKGECDRKWEWLHDEHMAWDELAQWYVFLANNAGLTQDIMKRARETVHEMARLGL